MLKLILFWLKYKRINIMSTEQYNEGIKYAQMLELNDLFEYFNGAELKDTDKLVSLYKNIGEHDILTNIASCAIKPRFRKWNPDNRLKYCKDLSRSINLCLNLSGFFLSNFGLRRPTLGNSLQILSKK